MRESLKSFKHLLEEAAGVTKSNNALLKSLRQDIGRRDLFMYRQVEALIELNARLGFSISGLRGWAISPDAGLILYKEVIKAKPSMVVELGGGASSVIVAQALKANKKGKLVSIDHMDEYARGTQKLLDQHGLSQIAEVRVAKLSRLKSGAGSWYDVNKVRAGITSIDFLVVDGPPEAINKNARQPAVPLLKDLLSKKAVIFMDDYGREDEQAEAKTWLKLLKGTHLETFDTEKGTAIIRSI